MSIERYIEEALEELGGKLYCRECDQALTWLGPEARPPDGALVRQELERRGVRLTLEEGALTDGQ